MGQARLVLLPAVVCALLTWVAATGSARAANVLSAELVADVRPGPGGSFPEQIAADLGGVVLFTAYTPATGFELWRTDGSEAGTELVRDINPGIEDGFPDHFAVAGGIAYFNAFDEANGRELWRSDGTAAGTTRVADIEPGVNGSVPQRMTPFGDKVIFGADRAADGREPWISDGTAAGTERLADINPGAADSAPAGFAELGGKMMFSADRPADGRELWSTDGTMGGTGLVLDINPGAVDSGPNVFERLGSHLYFPATQAGTDRELWRTDGTVTQMVADIDPGAGSGDPRSIAAIGNKLLFRADDGTATGVELYTSTGTPGNFSLVEDINPAGDNNFNGPIVEFNGLGYLTANNGTDGFELWRTDGEPGGAGTSLVKDIWPGPLGGSPRELTLFDGMLYFSANDGVTGSELWRTDGTTAGTELFADIRPVGESVPERLFATDNHLFFRASEQSTGTELWAVGDFSAPETSIDAGPDDGVATAERQPVYEFSSDEPGTFECRVDDAAFAACSSPLELGPLAYGTHSFEVRALDAGGIADPPPARRELTVDFKVNAKLAGKRIPFNGKALAAKIGCPAAELSGPCKGRIKIKTAGRIPPAQLAGASAKKKKGKKKGRKVSLGHAKFEIAAGKRKKAKVKVPKVARQLLLDYSRARRVQAIVRVRDGLGNSRKLKKKLKVKLRVKR